METIKSIDIAYKPKKFQLGYIEKAIKGDKESFVYIIKENKEYLYKTAYMYVKDESKALEIMQETITRGYINIGKLKEPAFFKTWITRILINVAIDMIKKDSKFEELNDSVYLENIQELSIEEKLDLYNAIDLLSERYKTILIMRYYNDMKIQDIAMTMEIPESTVKSRINRAKVELKSILKEGYLNE